MLLLTARQLSEILNVPVARVYELARTKMIPVVRVGRSVRFPEDKLRQWIDSGGQALPGGWQRSPDKGRTIRRSRHRGKNSLMSPAGGDI